jgi:hypothetical protein
MARAARLASVVAALIVLGVLPATAQAQHRGQGVRGHGHPSPMRGHGQLSPVRGHGHPSPLHQRFHHRPLGSRFVVVAPFFPFGYYSASSVVYSAPPVDYAPPPVMYPTAATYGPPPAYAGPPAPMYAPPQPPTLQQDLEPIQREVVFPSGRYVLRGDGINTPYTWVWIPNPPTAPPGGAPSGSRSRDAERTVYAWTDGNGVTTWTDRVSQVPPEHRAAARRDF